MVLDKVILHHDPKELLHLLEVHLRIPLILTGEKTSGLNHAPINMGGNPMSTQGNQLSPVGNYSTVTDFAKLRGWSTLQPRKTATW